jgi:hypothetical protein
MSSIDEYTAEDVYFSCVMVGLAEYAPAAATAGIDGMLDYEGTCHLKSSKLYLDLCLKLGGILLLLALVMRQWAAHVIGRCTTDASEEKLF